MLWLAASDVLGLDNVPWDGSRDEDARAEVLAKQDRAIDLVRAGKSYDEIARALG